MNWAPPAGTYWVAFGARVREARDLAELTQTELARRLGRSRSSVANIEAGRQRALAADVVTIAGLLHADAGWLLCGPAQPARFGLSPEVLQRARATAYHDVTAAYRAAERAAIDLRGLLTALHVDEPQ